MLSLVIVRYIYLYNSIYILQKKSYSTIYNKELKAKKKEVKDWLYSQFTLFDTNLIKWTCLNGTTD